MPVRLLYIVSHPIQYQAPLLRLIAAEDGIDLRVLFENTGSTGRHYDPGFGREIEWDVDLCSGYDNAALDDGNLEAEIGNCDVLWVHGWQTGSLRSAIAIADSMGKPVLMRGENWAGAMPDGPGLRGIAKRLYLRKIFRHCRGFLCIGSMNRQYYSDHGIGDDRLFDMPYAIDNRTFAEKAGQVDIAGLRRTLSLPEGRRVILYAGKLSARKHPDVLLEAWQSAAWDGDRPVLLFVGDGELSDSLRRQADGDDDVIFAGFRNQGELPGIYALADVFVLAASAEAWGLAINEAMACGTAVIASDQCGAAHDLVDNSNGRVVPAGDSEALARVLPEVLSRSGELGRDARERIGGWGFDEDLSGLRQALEAVL